MMTPPRFERAGDGRLQRRLLGQRPEAEHVEKLALQPRPAFSHSAFVLAPSMNCALSRFTSAARYVDHLVGGFELSGVIRKGESNGQAARECGGGELEPFAATSWEVPRGRTGAWPV